MGIFTNKVSSLDTKFLEGLPYNHLSCDWSGKYFDSQYQAAWIPKNIPTLIISGREDVITPLALFKSNLHYKDQQNIQMETIANAGHFPWIEQPEMIKELFKQYINRLGRVPNNLFKAKI